MRGGAGETGSVATRGIAQAHPVFERHREKRTQNLSRTHPPGLDAVYSTWRKTGNYSDWIPVARTDENSDPVSNPVIWGDGDPGPLRPY